MLEIQVLAWDRQRNVAGLNWLMGSQPSPLDNWIFNCNTDIYILYIIETNDNKPAQIHFHSKQHYYYHKNERQHKHGQYDSGVNEFL
jgi:hypothetical protein